MEIKELRYGNPDRSNKIQLERVSYLDGLIPELTTYDFPPNDGEVVKEEIAELVSVTNSLSDNSELTKRFELYDSSLEKYFIQSVAEAGAPQDQVAAIVSSVREDTLPILVKLKYHFQRPRPIQLSMMLGMDLYPYASKTADSPSYPAGHAFQARLYAEVLGNMYPNLHKALHDLATDVMWSRIYMGIHYQSDCRYADYVAKVVCAHPDFRRKYKL